MPRALSRLHRAATDPPHACHARILIRCLQWGRGQASGLGRGARSREDARKIEAPKTAPLRCAARRARCAAAPQLDTRAPLFAAFPPAPFSLLAARDAVIPLIAISRNDEPAQQAV